MAWITPKTNWTKDDYFNINDYNRIKNNLNEIRTRALKLWGSFPFIEMGDDKTYSDYGFYADEINNFEENVEKIKAGTVHLETGKKKTFNDNQTFIDFIELNRIEKACEELYANVLGRENGLKRLSFKLKGGEF